MFSNKGLVDDLRLAQVMADNADILAMRYFRSADLDIHTKLDGSEVTIADNQIEKTIRDMIAKYNSNDAIQGEEFGSSGVGNRRWIIDPIDGTANYLRGVPIWATLIALMIDDEVVMGVVSAPALSKRWWAGKGLGAYSGSSLAAKKELKVSKVDDLSQAFLSYSSLHGWHKIGKDQSFAKLMKNCWRTRAFGDFWSYMLVAEGVVDLAAEPELALHDMAALDIIMREAGGTFTNLEGVPGPHGPGAVATNGLLHEEVISLISGFSS